MTRFDAVIVGASYAGLACAAQMPGRKLLLLERHPSVVTKTRGCLGLLLPLGQKVEVRGQDLFFHGLNLLVEGGIQGKLSRLEVRGLRERVDFHLDHSLVILDEARIKGALLRRVKENGAEVRVGAPVREIQSDGRLAKVRADEDHNARLLVGADGVNSLVARSLGWHRERMAMLFQRELEVSRLDIPAETFHLQIDDARNFFIAIPIGDRYLATMFQVVDARGAPTDLDRICRDKAERLGAGRVLAAREAVVRLYQPLARSYHDNVVLAGDAAAAFGLATINGALTMGALAGSAANRYLSGSRYALPDYHQRWRKATSQGTLDRLHWILPVLNRVDSDRVDGLLRAIRGPTEQVAASGGGLWWRLPAVLWRLFV